MAIATKSKPKTSAHKKRLAQHHRQTKHYVKSYWPYLPIVAVVAVGLFVNTLLDRPTQVLGAHSDLTSQALLTSTNADRTGAQETTLQLNAQLMAAAQAKANDMVQKNYWSHITPSGQQPWSFITQAGYQYRAAGENLAYGFSAANSTLSAWMHSPEHRANILDTAYTEVGFGVAESPNYVGSGPETVIVALYAKPTSAVVAQTRTLSPTTAEPVSRLQTVSNSAAISDLVVGLVGSLAILVVLVRHGIAWRKLLNRGELFAVQHPTLDITLVSLAMVAFILNHTVGFIR